MVPLHTNVTKEAAEELIRNSALGLTDGVFLFREYADKPGEYVLMLVYKGRVTNHLVTRGADSLLLVNKKSFGAPTTLAQLVAVLSTSPLPSQWPIALTHAVFPQPIDSAVGASATRGPSSGQTARVHAALSKADADMMLSAQAPLTDGRFLLREQPGNFPFNLIVSVVYKGKCTHHSCTRESLEEPYVINSKHATASYVTTPEALVSFLGTSHPWWPVPLSDCILPARGAEVLANSAAAPHSMSVNVRESQALDDKIASERLAVESEARIRVAQAAQERKDEERRRVLIEGPSAVSAIKREHDVEMAKDVVASLRANSDVAKAAVWKWEGAVQKRKQSQRADNGVRDRSETKVSFAAENEPEGVSSSSSSSAAESPVVSPVASPSSLHRPLPTPDSDSDGNAAAERIAPLVPPQSLPPPVNRATKIPATATLLLPGAVPASDESGDDVKSESDVPLRPKKTPKPSTMGPEMTFSYVPPSIVTSMPVTTEDQLDLQRYPSTDGVVFEVTLSRRTPHVGFGFGVAAVWRLDGGINAVSVVEETMTIVSQLSSREATVAVGDQILKVNNKIVDDAFLDDLKAVLTDQVAGAIQLKLTLFRRHISDSSIDEVSPQKGRYGGVTALLPLKKIAEKSKKCSKSVWCHCAKCDVRMKAANMEVKNRMAEVITLRRNLQLVNPKQQDEGSFYSDI